VEIKSVEPILIDRFLFVIVRTANGLTGIGESGAWGQLEASAAAIRKFADYLVGQDARRIELHWNVMQRASHFTGAAVTGAVSAIDIALWDIKGKALGVPVHELLGGRMRDTARVYGHVKGKTIESLIAGAKRLKAEGFTAIGHLNPLLDDAETPYFKPHAVKMREATNNIRRLREAVGDEVDLCVEIHRRLTPAEAVSLGRAIEPYNPMFYEDPIPPNGADSMAWVADHIPIPVATGERFTSIFQFQALLARRGVEYVRPCLCLCGGITAARKIAAMAEAQDVQVVPHNPLSAVSLAACLHLDATIPNFAIQEYPCLGATGDDPLHLQGHTLFTKFAAPIDGFIAIPDSPGLGIEFAADFRDHAVVESRPIRMRRHRDGSVVEH
jgi:galactonate dehydratase